MPKFERVEDRWKDLRKDLYGNVEPEVRLEAITMPIDRWTLPGMGYIDKVTSAVDKNGYINWKEIEQIPSIAAGVSYGSKEKLEGDQDRALKLNKSLIDKGHHTPLEAIQLNFFVSGISKACGAQISRHRVGQGHVSASRRFQTAGAGFVYPTLDYIEDENAVRVLLKNIAKAHEDAYSTYLELRSERKQTWQWSQEEDLVTVTLSPLHKEDARVILPVSYATERTWFINVRALRDFFRLRLAADAESEIRRLAFMMFDIVKPLMPSLFADFGEI